VRKREKPKKLLNDLLDSLKNSYKPADHLKTALKQNTSLKSLNDTVPQLEEKGNSVIRLGIGQAQLSYTHHTIDIACKGNALTIKCVTDNLYFQGLIKNKRLESATIANCNSPSEAIQKANRLIRTVAYLGYVVPVKKAKKIA